MKRPIVQHPNEVLRIVSADVAKKEFGSPKLEALLNDMSDTLHFENDGVALAAPQIGINKRIFVIAGKVFTFDEPETQASIPDDLICINPEILKISRDRKLMHEGCLSVRPLYGDIRRASRVTIRAQDKDGKHFELAGTGLLAEIFQHEIDHLNGILFIDTALNIKDGELGAPEKKTK